MILPIRRILVATIITETKMTEIFSLIRTTPIPYQTCVRMVKWYHACVPHIQGFYPHSERFKKIDQGGPIRTSRQFAVFPVILLNQKNNGHKLKTQ